MSKSSEEEEKSKGTFTFYYNQNIIEDRNKEFRDRLIQMRQQQPTQQPIQQQQQIIPMGGGGGLMLRQQNMQELSQVDSSLRQDSDTILRGLLPRIVVKVFDKFKRIGVDSGNLPPYYSLSKFIDTSVIDSITVRYPQLVEEAMAEWRKERGEAVE